MQRSKSFLVLFFKKELLLLGFVFLCAAQPESPASYKVVLVAGDDSLRVFDHATAALQRLLLARQGIAPSDIQGLSALRAGAQLATLPHVLEAVADMKPAPGQGCLVFATSHGVEDGGLWLAASQAPMSPLALDLALSTGCGDAPTVVIVSSCFSGIFAQAPMTKPNRIILAAARPDRTSFGCKAGRRFTVYDQCLLRAFGAATTWRQAYELTRACVGREEVREQVVPSEPQAWFGREVADLPLPARKVVQAGAEEGRR